MVVQVIKLSVRQFSSSSQSGENEMERNHFQIIFFLMGGFLHMLTFLCSKLSALSWAFCFLITFLFAEYVTQKQTKQQNHPPYVNWSPV